jgi:gamma-glutamyltranspeptidase/glutathione hydrolase
MMRTHINPKKAADAASDIHERGGDTTYFCVVDYEGNAISFINSLFHPFGSGMVAGDTGIVLQNRGLGFSFEPGHPNSLQSHKRPMHTLIPCMVFRDSRPVLILGCIGGDQQPQGLLQILMNIIDFGMSPQDAIDAPRWRSYEDGSLIAESALGAKVVQDLSARGHRVLDELDFFGGSQCIMFNDDGILRGGSDPRLAGCWQGLP